MKFIKGISIYTGLDDYPISKTIKYLETAKTKGIDFVFTSAHIDEAVINDELQIVIDQCKKLDLELVIDVSKKAFVKIQNYLDFIVPRLDYGFSDEEIVFLSNKLRLIELNASLIDRNYLEKLKMLGVNFSHIRVSYNFYPKRYTALDINEVKELNKLYKEYDLTVIAYIPSNSNKRPPLYDGLPSVESHRYKDIKIAAYELMATHCDGVCIGDAYISIQDLDKLIEVSSDYYEIPIDISDGISTLEMDILKEIHPLRKDASSYLKRSSLKRGTEILPNNTFDKILPYMITIDNINYLRYKGELGIALKEMENKGQVNIVGTISNDARDLIDLIIPPAKIKFIFNK